MTDVATIAIRRDPLAETLFRPTVVPDAEPGPVDSTPTGTPSATALEPAARASTGDGSAAPRRAAGTRVRAGNAMARTRAALLDGALRAVAADGTGITMAQVATLAGVAKATLYNHFRTREAVLAALATTEVEAVADEVGGLPLRHALVEIAAAVATHPCLATLREREPGVLAAALAAPEPSDALLAARAALATVVRSAGLAPEDVDLAADVLLRWLASLALAPAAPADVLASVDLLLAGLLA